VHGLSSAAVPEGLHLKVCLPNTSTELEHRHAILKQPTGEIFFLFGKETINMEYAGGFRILSKVIRMHCAGSAELIISFLFFFLPTTL
jgi:hypothetical protein